MVGTGEVLVREWMMSVNGRVPHPMLCTSSTSSGYCPVPALVLNTAGLFTITSSPISVVNMQYRSVPSAHIPTPALIHTATTTQRPPCPTSTTTFL